MLPTTDIIYNHEYAKRLYHGDENFKDVWRRILGLGADFEKIHEEYTNQILKSIEKYSGFTWEGQAEDYLPIYLVDAGPSLTHPLTLAVDNGLENILRDFIYQLAHRNMYFGFPSDEIKDKCLYLVTDHVMDDLNLDSIKKFNGEKTNDWDLRNKTIKEYLKL